MICCRSAIYQTKEILKKCESFKKNPPHVLQVGRICVIIEAERRAVYTAYILYNETENEIWTKICIKDAFNL